MLPAVRHLAEFIGEQENTFDGFSFGADTTHSVLFNFDCPGFYLGYVNVA